LEINNRKSLTLVELIMVIGMMGILTATVSFVYNLHFKSWNEVYTRSVIRGRLSQTLELMGNRLLQAQSIDAFTESSITFTADLGSGSDTYRLYLYNANDPNPPPYTQSTYSLLSAQGAVNDGDGVVLSPDIVQPSSPPFVMNGKVITINLTARRGAEQVTMNTSVRPRNL
jgi:Tfp pilus assembly protein PilE